MYCKHAVGGTGDGPHDEGPDLDHPGDRAQHRPPPRRQPHTLGPPRRAQRQHPARIHLPRRDLPPGHSRLHPGPSIDRRNRDRGPAPRQPRPRRRRPGLRGRGRPPGPCLPLESPRRVLLPARPALERPVQEPVPAAAAGTDHVVGQPLTPPRVRRRLDAISGRRPVRPSCDHLHGPREEWKGARNQLPRRELPRRARYAARILARGPGPMRRQGLGTRRDGPTAATGRGAIRHRPVVPRADENPGAVRRPRGRGLVLVLGLVVRNCALKGHAVGRRESKGCEGASSVGQRGGEPALLFGLLLSVNHEPMLFFPYIFLLSLSRLRIFNYKT